MNNNIIGKVICIKDDLPPDVIDMCFKRGALPLRKDTIYNLRAFMYDYAHHIFLVVLEEYENEYILWNTKWFNTENGKSLITLLQESDSNVIKTALNEYYTKNN